MKGAGVKQPNLGKGVDKPMPVAKKTVRPHGVVCTGMQPLMERLRLDPSINILLADRFPQWVRPPEQGNSTSEPNG